MRAALIIVGPSCVGKTTVANKLISTEPRFELVRSATTRPPRGDGNDGEYIYLTREEFSKRAEVGEMLEYMEYGDNLYGTPKSELDRIFSLNKAPLLILDINGAKSVRAVEMGFLPIIIYLYADISTIESRLHDRYLKSDVSGEKFLTFSKRKEANLRDYRSLSEIHSLFDAFVKNSDVEKSVEEILGIYRAVLDGKFVSDPIENEKIAHELCGHI